MWFCLWNTKDWYYIYEPFGREANRIKLNWFFPPWSSWRNRMWTQIRCQPTYFCEKNLYLFRLNSYLWASVTVLLTPKAKSYLVPSIFLPQYLWICLLLPVTIASDFLTSSNRPFFSLPPSFILPPKSNTQILSWFCASQNPTGWHLRGWWSGPNFTFLTSVPISPIPDAHMELPTTSLYFLNTLCTVTSSCLLVHTVSSAQKFFLGFCTYWHLQLIL